VHSRIGFAVEHLGINIVKGRFETFEGASGMAGSRVSVAAFSPTGTSQR